MFTWKRALLLFLFSGNITLLRLASVYGYGLIQNLNNPTERGQRSSWETELLIVLVFALAVLLIYFKNYKRSKASLKAQIKINESLSKEIEKQKVQLIELKSKAVIEASQITFIKSDGHYLELYLKKKDKPEIDRNSLKNMRSLLPDYFIQIHKSYLINLKEIRVKHADKIEMKTGQELPISRTYKTSLNELLKKLSQAH